MKMVSTYLFRSMGYLELDSNMRCNKILILSLLDLVYN
jgi:hypothetical protein